MAQSLRELVLSLKVKVDKAAIKETDTSFDHATKTAEKFERATAEALWPLKKIGEQLDANTKKAREFAARLAAIGPAVLPAGALPSTSRPEAPSDVRARNVREALGMSDGPRAPTPGRAAVIAAPNVDDFVDKRSRFQRLRDSANEAFKNVGVAAQQLDAKMSGVTSAVLNVRNAFVGLAAVAAGSAIFRFVNDVVQSGAELHTMAQRTRMSVETLQVWRQVAAGVNADASAVTGAFQRLSRSINGAANGSKAQAKAFQDLGVEFKGRQTEDVLIDVGSALAALDDDAKASALAVQLLGPAGAALVPAFKGGADAVRKLTAELRENVAMNAEEAARLEEVGSAVERGTKKWIALKTRAIVLMLPLLERLSSGFEKASKWILRMSKETSTFQTIAVSLTGGALFRLATGITAWIARVGGARAALGLLGQGLRAAAGFALRFIAPLLVIEDFLTFLAGGKSLFGRAFEEIFGSGGAKMARDEILAFFNSASNFVTEELLPALRELAPIFQGIATVAGSVVLGALNLIGMALSDNEAKTKSLAEAFERNMAPAVQKVADMIQAIGRVILKIPGMSSAGFAITGVGDDLKKMAAEMTNSGKSIGGRGESLVDQYGAANAVKALGGWKPPDIDRVVPKPAAPPTPKAPVTLTDNRKIEVNVGPNPSPGAVGRAVGGAVDGALTQDRRQVMNAL